MTCQHYLPSPHLRPYIAYFWTLESDEKREANCTFHLVPDGYIDWVFHLNEPWEYSQSKKENKKQKYNSHIFGQTKNHITMALPSGKLNLFGIKFQPWAARQIWGFDMHEATDMNLSFSDIDSSSIFLLEEKINETKSMKDKIKKSESFFEKNISFGKKDNLSWAINHIFQKSSIEGLYENISQRRLEQRFKSEIGISPKMFQRTVRINRAIQEIIRSPKPYFTDIAYQFGYFDQSHFIREFKQFTGVPPSKFCHSINPSRDIFNLKIKVL